MRHCATAWKYWRTSRTAKLIIMKYIRFLIAVVLSLGSYSAGFSHGGTGVQLPVEGEVRVLLVFAEMDCAPCASPDPNNPNIYNACHDPHPGWPTGDVPPDAGDYFYPSVADITTANAPGGYITKYFYDMSMGEYKVVGDYYEDIITVDCNNATNVSSAATDVISQLNNLPGSLVTKNGYPLSYFDAFGGEGTSVHTPGPNGVLDVVIIVFRNLPWWGGQTGYGVSSWWGANHVIDGYNMKMGAYFNAKSSGTGAMDFVIAEYFHGMYGSNNWHLGSGAGTHSFFTKTAAYGLANQGGQTNVACGWDRQFTKWFSPSGQYFTYAGIQAFAKTMSISALDANGIEASSDISIETHPNGATFKLRDFIRYGDAIRIKLPHINWENIGDVKNQYLWIENHQKLSSFDKGQFEGQGCHSFGKGIRMYVEVGKDVVDDFYDSNGQLVHRFNASSNEPNGLASWLWPLSAQGNYDLKYEYAYTNNNPGACQWTNGSTPVNYSASLANPFTGHNDHTMFDNTADGTYGNGTGEVHQGWFERMDSQGNITLTMDYYGSQKSAWTQTGKIMNMGTNPTPTTVYSYKSGSTLQNHPSSPASYDNRVIYLNGIAIEITEADYTGDVDNAGNTDSYDYTVRVRFDNYYVGQDTRWCGNICLLNDDNDPLERQSQINVGNGVEVILDQGTTATKPHGDPIPGGYLFADPTVLTLESGTKMEMAANSVLRIKNDATLHIKSGATLDFIDNGLIIVEETGHLCIEEGAIINFSEETLANIMFVNGGGAPPTYYTSDVVITNAGGSPSACPDPDQIVHKTIVSSTGMQMGSCNIPGLKAHEKITFTPGFIATQGSAFYAKIDAIPQYCDNTYKIGETHDDYEEYVEDYTTDRSTSPVASAMKEMALSIAPNPNNGLFTLQWENADEVMAVEIYDVQGKQVFYQQYQNVSKTTIDIHEQPRGIYLIKCTSRNNIITEKIVKQ